MVHNNSSNDENKKAEKLLNNISAADSIIDNYESKPKTQIGKLCFENNINIFDVLAVEEEINGSLSTVSQARDLAAVFNIINVLFFSRIKHGENNNLMRLKEEKAQIFYRMLIEWRIKGFSMKEMSDMMVKYWDNLEDQSKKEVFVGRRGDKIRGGGFMPYWTDITKKITIQR